MPTRRSQQQPQQQQTLTADFSDPELEAIKRYAQALGLGETPFDSAVEARLVQSQRSRAREEGAAKMEAAKRGGGDLGLGPTQAEQTLAKQRVVCVKFSKKDQG